MNSANQSRNTLSDVSEHQVQFTKKYIIQPMVTLLAVDIIFIGYFASLMGACYYSKSSGRPITTQKQLEQELISSKNKLGCMEDIVAVLVENDRGDCRRFEDHYLIQIGGKYANTKCLEHEVIHAHHGDPAYVKNVFDHLVREHRAMWYTITSK